jgi:hypothetical protein
MRCWAGSRRFPTRVRPRAARVVMSAGLPQGPSRWPRWRPVGGRRPEALHICPGVRPPRTPAWPHVPDIGRPDGGHSGSSGRSSADGSDSYDFLYSSSRVPRRPCSSRSLNAPFIQVVEAIVSSVAPQAIPAGVVMVHGEGDVGRLLVKASTRPWRSRPSGWPSSRAWSRLGDHGTRCRRRCQWSMICTKGCRDDASEQQHGWAG